MMKLTNLDDLLDCEDWSLSLIQEFQQAAEERKAKRRLTKNESIEEKKARLLKREEYAQMGAERKKLQAQSKLDTNEKVAAVFSTITSLEDLTAIIPEEKDTCLKIALCYAQGDQDRADDIYQQALYNAFQNLKSGEPYRVSQKAVRRIQLDDEQMVNPSARLIIVKSPAAWLHTIVRNVGCNESLRKRRANSFLKQQVLDLERESRLFEPLETTVLRNISNAELHDYVNALPERFSRIINLHYFKGFSYEEIAQELKCPPSTVRVSAKRALDMLKDVLTNKRDVKEGRIGRPKTSNNHCSAE